MPALPALLEPPVSFAAFVWRRAMHNRSIQVAASLTFTTLLSLVPLFTIALIVVSAFPVFDDISAAFKTFLLTNLVPDFAGKVITVYLKQFTDNAGKLTAVGVGALGVTALSLMLTIDSTFNSIWRVRKRRPLMQNMLVYWTVLTLGPILLGVGISGSAWLLRESGLGHRLPWFASLIQDGGTLLLSTLMLTVLYGLVPNRHVPLSQALTGAFCTSLVLGMAKWLFALYLSGFKSYQFVYGAFATFPIMLLWLQLLWLVVLLGAETTAALSYWRGAAWRREFEAQRQFRDAVEALLCLADAQREGRALTQPELRRVIDTGYDEIGLVLDELTLAGYVQRGERDRWALLRRPEDIRLDDLFRRFVLDTRAGEDEVARGLSRLMMPVGHQLDLSLAEFGRQLQSAGTGRQEVVTTD
ncbi:MAG: YihY family inner membrane protein [Microvirgula sp.]